MCDRLDYRKHEYPFRLRELPDAAQKRIHASFEGCPSGLQSCNHWNFKLSATATYEEIEKLYNMPVKADDVWVVSPPKCGTTWTQELVWIVANDFDFKSAERMLMGPDGRYSFIDFEVLIDKEFMKSHGNPFNFAAKPETSSATDRHFIKSHLPFSMNNPDLLDTCKVVYVARNPKDACVSFYHHCRLIRGHNFVHDFETFLDFYLNDEIVELPMVEHMIEAWNLRHHPNMCFLFYEDMKRDLPNEIRRVAKFLNKHPSEVDIQRLAQHLRFDNFKNNKFIIDPASKMFNPNSGSFIRKGKTGDWKNYFSDEMNVKFDTWLHQRLKGSDLKFIETLDHQD